jgi:hypothetical protein
MTDIENHYQTYDIYNNINSPLETNDTQNNYPDNEQMDQNNFENNLLHGVNSNLNALLSNLKGNNTSTDIKRFNSLNTSFKSPTRQSSNNFSNMDLVDAYNFLVETNTKRKSSYFSPNHSKLQNNNNINIQKKNSLCSYSRTKTTDNEFRVKKDLFNLSKNDNNNSYYSQQINYNKRNNNSFNRSRLINKTNDNNTQRDVNLLNIYNNSKINRPKKNNRQIRISANNNMNLSPQPNSLNNQLYNIINQIKELNMCNSENKNDVLNIQQEYFKMQNILLSAIKKFANNNNQNQKTKNYNIQIKQVNDMKNKLLSDINKLNNEKNEILNEISRLKKNEEKNINIINSKEIENKILKDDLKNLNHYKES